jgi:hypothetical protein
MEVLRTLKEPTAINVNEEAAKPMGPLSSYLFQEFGEDMERSCSCFRHSMSGPPFPIE